MKKKIIKKKVTIQDLSEKLDLKIDELGKRMDNGFNAVHDRIDNFRDHVDRRFDEQTADLTNQIHDILELVDNRITPIEKKWRSKT